MRDRTAGDAEVEIAMVDRAATSISEEAQRG